MNYPTCRVCKLQVIEEGLIFSDGTAAHFECCNVSKEMAWEHFPQARREWEWTDTTQPGNVVTLTNEAGTVTVELGRQQFHERELSFKPSRVPDTLREMVEES